MDAIGIKESVDVLVSLKTGILGGVLHKGVLLYIAFSKEKGRLSSFWPLCSMHLILISPPNTSIESSFGFVDAHNEVIILVCVIFADVFFS